ncbi:16850_t:CDS:2, partial [Acaulospora morrowiae]
MVISEKEKSNIKWILISANPAPLEFYRHLNRKTKRDAHDAYHLALSTILTKSKGVCKEKLEMLKEIQKKWKNDDFKNDWNKYIAERSAESIYSSYKVQRSYNYEVSSCSLPKRKRSGPSTPDKPVIQPLKQLYPQVSFTRRAKIVNDKLHNENLVKNDSNQLEESENDDQIGKQGNHNENEENRDDHGNQDQVVA